MDYKIFHAELIESKLAKKMNIYTHLILDIFSALISLLCVVFSASRKKQTIDTKLIFSLVFIYL